MKIFKVTAYVLVEKTNFKNTRHVSVLLEYPMGKIEKEMDLELTDQDIASAEKIIKQFNESEFGKQVQILTKVK